ncbi:hypothetical protein PTKIN_Ptkin12aG0117700 [Pterospermum kingtungense]
MNYWRLVSSRSWLARKLYTAASEKAMKAVLKVAAPMRNSLYSKLSALGATGGTVLRALNDFIMEGKRIRKDELSCCIKQLRKYHHYQHSLDIIDWIEKRKMQFSLVDHAIRLDLIAKTKGIGAAEDYLSSFPPNAHNLLAYGALLNCYCNNLIKDEALALFNKMDKLKLINNTLPFNNLMCMYVRLGEPQKSYVHMNDIGGVESVTEELANDSEDKCTWTTYSNLAAIYVKAGLFEKAEVCLKKLERDKMPHQCEAYHFLISLYSGTSNRAEVYQVWEALKFSFFLYYQHELSYYGLGTC